MKLSTLKIVSALGGLALLMGGLALHSSSHKAGLLAGCNKIVSLMINPITAPECVMHNGELVVKMTNPFTNQEILIDTETGEPVQE